MWRIIENGSMKEEAERHEETAPVRASRDQLSILHETLERLLRKRRFRGLGHS
jgi:hypothetical protein